MPEICCAAVSPHPQPSRLHNGTLLLRPIMRAPAPTAGATCSPTRPCSWLCAWAACSAWCCCSAPCRPPRWPPYGSTARSWCCWRARRTARGHGRRAGSSLRTWTGREEGTRRTQSYAVQARPSAAAEQADGPGAAAACGDQLADMDWAWGAGCTVKRLQAQLTLLVGQAGGPAARAPAFITHVAQTGTDVRWAASRLLWCYSYCCRHAAETGETGRALGLVACSSTPCDLGGEADRCG